MAMYNSQTSSGTFFKPDVRVQYKAVEGDFNVYDVATWDVSRVPSISYFPIEHFMRFKTKDEWYQSDIMIRWSNIFTLKDPSSWFKYIGKYEYDYSTQTLRTISWELATSFWDGNFETVSVWILDDDRVVELIIAWMVQTDLTSKKKGDPEKVKLFKDWTFITLSAEAETITVWKKPRQKTIHKIAISWTTDEVPESVSERWLEIHSVIMNQIKKAWNPTEVKEDEEWDEAENAAQEVFWNIEDRSF